MFQSPGGSQKVTSIFCFFCLLNKAEGEASSDLKQNPSLPCSWKHVPCFKSSVLCDEVSSSEYKVIFSRLCSFDMVRPYWVWISWWHSLRNIAGNLSKCSHFESTLLSSSVASNSSDSYKDYFTRLSVKIKSHSAMFCSQGKACCGSAHVDVAEMVHGSCLNGSIILFPRILKGCFDLV